MAKYNGKLGKVTINGADRHVTNWEASEVEEQTDTSDTGDAGIVSRVPGLKDMTGTFELHYSSTAKPSSAPVIVSGTTLTNLVLYLDDSTTAIIMTSARVSGASLRSGVRDATIVRVEWVQTGSWSWT